MAYRRTKIDLNFLEIETQAEAKWFMLQGTRMEDMPKKKKKIPAVVITPGESDEAVMLGLHGSIPSMSRPSKISTRSLTPKRRIRRRR